MIIFYYLISLLLFATSTVKGTPIIQKDSIKYYDHFGDETGFSYYGDVMVTCQIGTWQNVCDLDGVYLIDPNDKIAAISPCRDQVTFRVDINETTKFGKYKCRHKNEVSTESFDFNYRFCSDKEQACTSIDSWKCSSNDKFCVVSAKGRYPCTLLEEPNFEKNWCINETKVVYCPEQFQSLCDVHGEGFYAKGLAQINGVSCFSKEKFDYPRLRVPYFSYDVRFNGPLRVDRSSWLYIVCPNCDKACRKGTTFTCALKDRSGVIVEKRVFDNCVDGFHIYNFDRPDAEIIYHESNNSLYCKLGLPGAVGLDISDSWEELGALPIRESGSHIQVKESGYYQCGFYFTYKTCSPYREFNFYTTWSEKKLVTIDKTTSQPSTGNQISSDFEYALSNWHSVLNGC